VTGAPTVSVLVTAYNRERYLGAAIESVLAQRFTDFEVIITDNQSTDGTAAIARAYASRDPRIRVEINERNLGQFGNRNRAASLARGRYLKYHDSDDVMYPHCLEVMVGLLEACPDAALALTASRAWEGGPTPMLLSPREAYRREFLGSGLFMGGPACGLIRTDVFKAVGGFADVGVHADYLFWMHACARHSVLLVPGDLFWYRVHPGQLLTSPDAARDYARQNEVVWALLGSAECPLDTDERRLARRNQAWTVAKQTLRDLRQGRFALAWYRVRHSGMGLADWMRVVRGPARDRLSGTPLDADGEFVVPEWGQTRRPPNC
jgi:glycosyltransferase involved in cell wall biosynthesis